MVCESRRGTKDNIYAVRERRAWDRWDDFMWFLYRRNSVVEKRLPQRTDIPFVKIILFRSKRKSGRCASDRHLADA